MNRTNRNNSNLSTKLGAYALAWAALLAAPVPAKAEIAYVAANETVTADNVNEEPLIALFGSTIGLTPETRFLAGPSTDAGGPGAFVQAIGGSGVLTDSDNMFYLSALAFGAPIGPAESFRTHGGTVMGQLPPVYSYGPGDWSLTGDAAYMGFYFTDDSGEHFGWARIALSVDGNDATLDLIDYAYEETPNTAITAGQTEDAEATPEPSSLALLALGGAGLLAYRRRRSARFI